MDNVIPALGKSVSIKKHNLQISVKKSLEFSNDHPKIYFKFILLES